MLFRKMQESDLDAVLKIEKECFKTPWEKDQYLYELNQNPYSNLNVLVDDNDEIVGYYDLWLVFEHAEIANIAVNKSYHRQGYGKMLMQHIEDLAMENLCETISLEVRVSNKPAIMLYQECGLIILNTKDGYYKDEDGFEDAYFMMKGI